MRYVLVCSFSPLLKHTCARRFRHTHTCNFHSLSPNLHCILTYSFCCPTAISLFFCFQLWALLHFIMPTLFDSHEEFNEWFSKDIESHAENKSAIDESEYFYELTFFLPISVGNYVIVYFLLCEEFF